MSTSDVEDHLPAHAPTSEGSTDAAVRIKRKRLSRGALYTRRFLRNRPAVAGLIIFAVIVIFSVLGGLPAKHSYLETDFLNLSAAPSSKHWFGTNDAGNDLYAETVHGLQRSLIIALVVSTGTTVISAVVGAAAAYFGGSLERVVLGIIHFLMVVPTFLILALFSNHSGGNWIVIAIIMLLVNWFWPARVIWTLSLSIRERDYVSASRYMGVSGLRIVVRHIIPNIGSLLIIQFTLGVVGAVMSETGLSFIGFGVKPPDVSLGALIGSGADTVSSAPWLFYFPAAALTLLTVSMALVADGLRDAFDPTSAAGGRA
ncbi:ABC transporter permease [Actinopolymorpha pittospori]|uniref:Oligopeptide transport system permease protein OppC n=1 Tax=Actinopolymorpha pittospori TaxID=648752 RepID=A0A927N4M2_9ACTN|nr:ABC transporter permease [Actinopolymorpha pittospori]MBE1612591.1 peptide/nickel transport system permease protein [Actinopolymorpha pittospori]